MSPRAHPWQREKQERGQEEGRAQPAEGRHAAWQGQGPQERQPQARGEATALRPGCAGRRKLAWPWQGAPKNLRLLGAVCLGRGWFWGGGGGSVGEGMDVGEGK